ncbi:set-3 [Parelaphostrongylus tenuis]|uniref:Set-3 n=1 Tax=Parelaphostrongylus tenuis TaxID=148309 RepID=A0AAD5QNH5_PARTN|nr:set-3 [Parelaphostrongylus tenuis]
MESDFFPPFSCKKSFPQLCTGVALGYEPKRGKYIHAIRDIPCGEVVCLDVGKVISFDPHLCSYCLNRLPSDRNERYCENCTDQDRMYGPFELPFMEKLQNLGMFRLAVHLVLSYSSEEIMTCLEIGEFKKGDISDVASTRSESLAAALLLQADPNPVDISSTHDLVTDIVNRLDSHPHWQKIPRAQRLETFKTLLKLISCRLMLNAHSIYFIDSLESCQKNARSNVPSGVGLFPVASWFNHSCRANVNSFFHGNKLIFISMGIRKGEEVCDNYGVSYFKHTREERRTFLADRGFTCDCSVCV